MNLNWSGQIVGKCSIGKKFSYRCDFGLDALPEGAGVVLVLSAQCVPHPDHVVTDAQCQAASADGGEAHSVDKATQGGQRPAAVQRCQVPAFNLRIKTKNPLNTTQEYQGTLKCCFRTRDKRTSLSMEVLMRSSRPSCNIMELMLKTILLWLWLSDDVPNRDHFDFPVRVRSHITISPLGSDRQTKGRNETINNWKNVEEEQTWMYHETWVCYGRSARMLMFSHNVVLN